jgi:uncharacterized HAD superfamily protein
MYNETTHNTSISNSGSAVVFNYEHSSTGTHKGLRFNEGKLRYDLVHTWAHEQMVRILTKGAQKYTERNWERGMAWSNVLSSLERHLTAIKAGEDYDQETGELHAAHLACNAHFLTAYYKIYPQGDDRPHSYLQGPKIGLDIDGVICDWQGAWCRKFGYNTPEYWNFSYNNKEHFGSFNKEELKEFYLNIPPLVDPSNLPFEPHCYITARSVPVELTKEWLQKHGFPTSPVHSIGWGESKVDAAKKAGIDIFVDDSYENFVELNKNGVCCFLYEAPWNKRYNVGFKRIKSLKELA